MFDKILGITSKPDTPEWFIKHQHDLVKTLDGLYVSQDIYDKLLALPESKDTNSLCMTKVMVCKFLPNDSYVRIKNGEIVDIYLGEGVK